MPNILSRLKEKIKSKSTNIKDGVSECKEIFQENFERARSKPKSKRKSFVLGATTVLGIFGITLFAPALSAVAKDLPKDLPPAPAPGQVCPTTGSDSFLMKEIGKTIIGLIGTICARAAQNGSYGLGILCGLLVSGAILKNQNKSPGPGK